MTNTGNAPLGSSVAPTLSNSPGADSERVLRERTEKRLEEEERHRRTADKYRAWCGGASFLLAVFFLIWSLCWTSKVTNLLEPKVLAAASGAEHAAKVAEAVAQVAQPTGTTLEAPNVALKASQAVDLARAVADASSGVVPPGIGLILLGKVLMTALLLASSATFLRTSVGLLMPLDLYLDYIGRTKGTPTKDLVSRIDKLGEIITEAVPKKAGDAIRALWGKDDEAAEKKS